MKKTHIVTVVIMLAGVLSASADYFQDFNGMGTSGTTAPAGWSMLSITGNSLDVVIPTSTEMASATAGSSTLVVWNQTDSAVGWSSQAANEGSTPSDPNRLLGTSPTGTRGSILQLSLNNSSGSTVNSVTLSYDMKTMAAGVLSGGFDPGAPDELPGYSFYFLDGSTWTHVSSLDLSSDGTASATFNYSTPVVNGGTMEFRWFDDNSYAYSPDTMYAIDNVSIIVPEPATLSLLTVGALVLIARRRKA